MHPIRVTIPLEPAPPTLFKTVPQEVADLLEHNSIHALSLHVHVLPSGHAVWGSHTTLYHCDTDPHTIRSDKGFAGMQALDIPALMPAVVALHAATAHDTMPLPIDFFFQTWLEHTPLDGDSFLTAEIFFTKHGIAMRPACDPDQLEECLSILRGIEDDTDAGDIEEIVEDAVRASYAPPFGVVFVHTDAHASAHERLHHQGRTRDLLDLWARLAVVGYSDVPGLVFTHR